MTRAESTHTTDGSCRTEQDWSFCDTRTLWTAVGAALIAALLALTPDVYGQTAEDTRARAATVNPVTGPTGETDRTVGGEPADHRADAPGDLAEIPRE